jgi:PIN domain nuclease of toxin-antitoxin system
LRLLLDTHVLLWALARPAKLPAGFRRELDDADVFVSAASIWEVAIKSSIGKIDASPTEILDVVAATGFELLPITGEHAAHVASLPSLHKDPFDRLLVAQAQLEPLVLVTNDIALRGYGDFVRLL